jgi:ABC-2 type transport system ATP-binding protein
MDEVEDLCDRVAIIARGRVVYEGALDELIASTAGRYDLRTTDDGPAAVIARRAPGIGEVTAGPRGLAFAGDERCCRLRR